MGGGFTPWRRDVDWFPSQETAIRPLLDVLSFTRGNPNWGYQLRFGLFEIPMRDAEVIASAMAVEAALKAAQPGEFVCVPVRFTNLVHATNVYIQPHMWGMWCVVQRAIDVNQMYGSTS